MAEGDALISKGPAVDVRRCSHPQEDLDMLQECNAYLSVAPKSPTLRNSWRLSAANSTVPSPALALLSDASAQPIYLITFPIKPWFCLPFVPIGKKHKTTHKAPWLCLIFCA
nr:hypothetical protein [Tanacetum cinerariifolium]